MQLMSDMLIRHSGPHDMTTGTRTCDDSVVVAQRHMHRSQWDKQNRNRNRNTPLE